MSLDYNKDYYVLTVYDESGNEIKIPSTEFKNHCHETKSLDGIEFILYLDNPGRVIYDCTDDYIRLDKSYAVLPDMQDELEKRFKMEEEKFKRKVFRLLNSTPKNGVSDFKFVKRCNVEEMPESYGLYCFRITKSDIQKLLDGDILYFDDEYTFAIGMADEDINHV